MEWNSDDLTRPALQACRWLFAGCYRDQLCGRLRKPAPSVPGGVGPVTHSQVQDPPSGLRHTPHVLMAPLVRNPGLEWSRGFSCLSFLPVRIVHLRLESAYWK